MFQLLMVRNEALFRHLKLTPHKTLVPGGTIFDALLYIYLPVVPSRRVSEKKTKSTQRLGSESLFGHLRRATYIKRLFGHRVVSKSCLQKLFNVRD